MSSACLAINQETIDSCKAFFLLLSKSDNLKMFLFAKNGLKISASTLKTLGITRKRYYKALKRLKHEGLIEKLGGIYFHTKFGKIIYQRNIVEVIDYKKDLEKMKMIDTLKHTKKYSEDNIESSVQKIVDKSINNNNTPLSTIQAAMSYEDMVPLINNCVISSENEILIATRVCPETVINNIFHKSKLGVHIKVLADVNLVKEYFALQNNEYTCFGTNEKKNNDNVIERMNVIGNPWYPNSKIERRIATIPFGMIIIDESQVGIELINHNDPTKFNAGILIRDEKFSKTMKRFYQKMWDKASENVSGEEKV